MKKNRQRPQSPRSSIKPAPTFRPGSPRSLAITRGEPRPHEDQSPTGGFAQRSFYTSSQIELALTAAVDLENAAAGSQAKPEGPRELRPDWRALGPASDEAMLARVRSAVPRWRGWVEPLRIERVEEKLLTALLLDALELDPLIMALARKLDWPAERLIALGDAPGFGERGQGLRRLNGGRAVNADPWLLFPGWLRDCIPLLPGEGSAKFRTLGFLDSLQRPPASGFEPSPMIPSRSGPS